MIDVGLRARTAREPLPRLFTQGMIRMDGTKMSKSKGNLISPQKYFDAVGADALRLFHLAVGPPSEAFDWTDQTDSVIDGSRRFLDKVWRLATEPDERRTGAHTASDLELRRVTHRTIRDVTAAIEGWSFHTAVSKLHELRTAIDRAASAEHGVHRDVFDESVDALLAMLAPMAPHVTSELWQRRHPGTHDVHRTPWPIADESLLRVERETLVVQVDGKVKDRLDVAPDLTEDDAVALALASERVLAALGGAEPSRVVARPPRLVNVVR